MITILAPLLIAQQLTLTGALERADANAYGNRIANAQVREQSAGELKALGGILPSIKLEAGYIRTTDPVGAFGTALRQRRIAQADFDPARLNYPDIASNYVGAVIVEQPLLNLDAHLGRAAAARASDAADARRDWTRSAIRLDVIRAYFGAVLAREKVATLEAAAAAGRAHVSNAEKFVAQGLATKSDALLARVKAGEIEAELLSAQGNAKLALRQLALLIGSPGDTAIDVPVTLPSYANVAPLLQRTELPTSIEKRADVLAASQMAGSARLDVRRSQAISVPRLNAFARYDWNSRSSAFAGDENWTVGVMASWTPFSGAADLGERRAAASRETAASTGAEAARAQAMLDAQSAEINREVTLARLEIARAGAEHGAEAHRIVGRKYAGGLATIVEVLDAAAAQTQSSLAFAHARYAAVVTAAEHLRAFGGDPADITQSLNRQFTGASK